MSLVDRHIMIEDISIPDPEKFKRLKKRVKGEGWKVEQITSKILVAEHNGGYELQDGYFRLAIYVVNKEKSITCTVSVK